MQEKIISDAFIEKYKNKTPAWGFNGLGYVVYKRCVTIETPVLCADMVWRQAGDLSVEQEIVGFDEFPLKSGKGNTRKIRIGKVTHNEIEEADTVAIELEDGTVLYSTPDHSWLADTGKGLEWIEAKDLVHTNHLNPSQTVHYRLPKIFNVWQSPENYETGYISGVYDGEGSIDRKRTIQFAQTDGCVLNLVETLLKKYNFKYSKSKKTPSKISKKDCYALSIYSLAETCRFLGTFRPKRLLEKFKQSASEINLVSKRKGLSSYLRVVRVYPVGKRKIAVLSTNIKTHITAGFPSHNTYARPKEDGTTEEWNETVGRCINGAQKIGAGYTKDEAERLYDLVFNLKCNFAGRMLWQLGAPTVERYGGASLLNCWFVSMNQLEDFCFVFENLMLGGGVGFSVKREDIHELPKVKTGVSIVHKNTKDADFIVPDSREGWVSLLRNVIQSFFEGGKSFSYSTILVRGAGEVISGFGGTASGPQILVDGITKIIAVLQAREGKKLRSVDVLDINNIIGSIVVAGNVRRSAQIAIGDPDDHLYVRAKNWGLGNIPNWRGMSNNSIYADSYSHISRDIWESGYEVDEKTGLAKGEPYGFINLPLSQKYGRLIDGPMKDSKLYPTDKDNCQGFNPCAEITLADGEACNLCELYLNNINSQEELNECAKLLYKTQKAVWTLPFHYEKTKEIVKKNMRIGLGVTGVCQAMDKFDWLDKCYKELRKFDKEWSKQRGWPESIKLTTVKPSGCSRKDSLIITSQGLMRLNEIGNVDGNQWQEIDGFFSSDNNPISKFFVNGKVKTRILRTEDGFEYESSLNHRYWINGQWKYVTDIKIGDSMTAVLGGYSKTSEPEFIKTQQKKNTNCNIIKQPSRMNPDLAFFTGLFYADGSVHEKGIRISFNRKDNDLICLLKKIVKENFDLDGHVDEYGGFYVNSVFLNTWLKKQGLLKNYCDELVLPKIIRQSSVTSVKAFITGFWRGDGGQHNLSNWSLCSVSKKFALDLAVLMRSVGYNVSVKNAGPGGYGKIDRWIILNRSSKTSRFHGTDFKDRFISHNLWSDKIVEILDSECETYDVEVKNSHQYVLNGVISHNTLSLLGGSTPGGHPAYSQFYIRRVRMASSDKLVNVCRELGYHVEYVKNFDGTEKRDTVVVEFPCESGENAIVSKDMTAVQQLDLVKKLQTYWADNAVSVTIYYRKNELASIKEWLKENYETGIKSVSFLLHSDHGFQQAPYQEITRDQYLELKKGVKPLDSVKVGDSTGNVLDVECAGGACPVR